VVVGRIGHGWVAVMHALTPSQIAPVPDMLAKQVLLLAGLYMCVRLSVRTKAENN